MAAAILSTKLFVPPPPTALVARPRLVERLNEGLPKRLTVISAAAGCGKTTLVSEWIARCGLRAAWVSLDEADRDPVRFLSCLVAAVRSIDPALCADLLSDLPSPPQRQAQAVVAALVDELSTTPGRFLLVLDDYHVVGAPPIDSLVAFLVEHLPSCMHLVITTREDPRLPLARWRARGQLADLRAADLRFSRRESAELLNGLMGLGLADADVADLEARTEGWIAGLQLAALSLRGREDATQFIAAFSGSHRFILDFLVEEVLLRQPVDVRRFLLSTSILERMCVPLCDALTGRDDARRVIDALERSNTFLVPLDDRREWYRYHHLFSEALRAHASDERPGQLASLHRTASAWLDEHGELTEAIRHSLAARDFTRAAVLLEQAWPAAEAGTIPASAWLGWVAELPENLARDRPALSACHAFALLGRGDLEAAEARLLDAERGAGRKPGPGPSGTPVALDLRAHVAVGRAYIAQARGNAAEAAAQAGRVLELLPESEALRRGQASMLLGIARWSMGDLAAAEQVFVEHTKRLKAAGNLPDAIETAVALSDIRLALGRLAGAAETLEELLAFVQRSSGSARPETAELCRALAELALEQGHPELSARRLEESREKGAKAILPVGRYRWWLARSRLALSQGDHGAALAALDEAERLFVRSPLPDFCPMHALRARVWLAQRKLARLAAWAREHRVTPDDEPCYLREFEHLTLARALVAGVWTGHSAGVLRKMRGFLDRLQQAAEEGGRTGSVVEILVLKARVSDSLRDPASALAHLERALAFAEPEGFVRVFTDEGLPLAELLQKVMIGAGPARVKEAAGRLVAAIMARQDTRAGSLVEPLSERERDVLRLLRTDLSGPQIARELCVSLSTVRTHTQNIYAKLGTTSRRAALRRADELGLS